MPKKAPEPEAPTPATFNWPKSTEKRSLFVTLNPAELETKSRELAGTVPQIANLEREAKSSASQWKARIEIVQCQQNHLSAVVSEGKEERNVECEWVFECSGIDSATKERIPHPDKKALIRPDTGEVIEVRDITSDDRQMALIDEQADSEGGPEA